jgi:hypothetical protein
MFNGPIGRRVAATIALALLSLGLAAQGSAALRSLSVGPASTRATGELVMVLEGEPFISCPMTLEKELSSRIPKVERSRLGTVRGALGTCSSFGQFTITLLTESWTINYNSFSGTLPSITGIHVEIAGFSFLYTAMGGSARCLYRGSLHMSESVTGGTIRTLRILEEFTFVLFRTLSGLCPARFILGGTQTLAPTLSIRLL